MAVGPICAQETGPVSIETIPIEILEKIFFFACGDDCNLALLQTSNSVATKLHRHSIVLCLLTLTTSTDRQAMFQQSVGSRAAASFCDPLRYIERVPRVELSARPGWYNEIFVGRLQVSLLKRVLKTAWDPLLKRDEYQPSAISHAYLWAELDEFSKHPTAITTEWLIDSRPDAVQGRYPWTRVYVWPRQGRIIVRDQLCNRSAEYRVPLLENMARLKLWSAV